MLILSVLVRLCQYIRPMDVRSESTADLLALCRNGDTTARDRLMRRFLPILQRWAHGRLPHYARKNAGTDDLVQLTLLRALTRVSNFQQQHEGAFLAYLRTIFLNQLRDELRRNARQALPRELADEQQTAAVGSPLEEAVGLQALALYEDALAQLQAKDREAVLMRLEFGYQYAEIATDLGLPSSNAARMRISRAIAQLADIIDVKKLRN